MMARYIFSNSAAVGAEGYAFAGFDDLGGEATEATHATALGRPMPDKAESIFRSLAPGERKRSTSGGYYFRVW